MDFDLLASGFDVWAQKASTKGVRHIIVGLRGLGFRVSLGTMEFTGRA